MNIFGRVGQLTFRIILGLLLAIVLIALLHTPEETGAWRGAKPALLEMMALALAGLALGQARLPRSGERVLRFFRSGPSLPILLLVLYGALSWRRSAAPDFSAAEWIRLACGAALYFGVSAALHQRRQIQIVVGVLAAVAALTSLAGLFTFGQTAATTVSASFGNAQLLAGFLLLLVPLLVALSFSDLALTPKVAIQGAAVLTVTALL